MEELLLTIRTRSSKVFESIGDEDAERTSSLFKPCQIPSKVYFNDCLCRVGEELGDDRRCSSHGTDKYSFDVLDIDEVFVGLLLLSKIKSDWSFVHFSTVKVGDDCVATSRTTLALFLGAFRRK